MQDTPPDTTPDDPLTEAARRLEQAAARVSRRLEGLTRKLEAAQAEAAVARDSDEDRARLAAALDEARAREAELAEAAAEAAEALDAAMGDLQLAAGREEDV